MAEGRLLGQGGTVRIKLVWNRAVRLFECRPGIWEEG